MSRGKVARTGPQHPCYKWKLWVHFLPQANPFLKFSRQLMKPDIPTLVLVLLIVVASSSPVDIDKTASGINSAPIKRQDNGCDDRGNCVKLCKIPVLFLFFFFFFFCSFFFWITLTVIQVSYCRSLVFCRVLRTQEICENRREINLFSPSALLFLRDFFNFFKLTQDLRCP